MTGRLLVACCLVWLATTAGRGQTPDDPLTLVTREDRRPLPTVRLDGRRMVAVSQLAASFDLTIADTPQPGRLTLMRGDRIIVLTANEGLVSVAGQLVALPSPPLERDGEWYVPIDFIGSAVALVHDEPVELRRRSGLVLLGAVRVPQIVARYQRSGRQSRLRLMVTPATEYVIEQDANRLVITLDADALDLELRDVRPDPLVSGIQGVDGSPALAIDLRENFGSFAATTEPALGGAVEIVIDLQPRPAEVTRAGPPRTPSPGSGPGPNATPGAVAVAGETGADAGLPVLSELAPRRAIRAIAIDAGHGGDDIGTRGPEGALEKDVTLAVAQRLRNRIESELGLRVVLTRTGDSTVSLDERAAIANNDRADLFISLHANASVRETATGAEVFYLSLAEYGDEARDAGFTGQLVPTVGGGTRVLDIVPWEMAQLRHADQSARWAETVADELSLRVPMSPRGLQQAPFRVLVGANMPAVVLEMGFISNPDQEAQLTSTTFQSSIVSGLLRSIIRYRDEIASEGTPVAPRDAVPPDATGRSR
jgi:N-acetylmuramoyl-L-alanine amidase